MKQFLKEFVHNVIVHPLMMVLPVDKACHLHDTNANWAFKERCDELHLEGLKAEEDTFETELTGNALATYLLNNGAKVLTCAVHTESEEEALKNGWYVSIIGITKDGLFEGNLDDWEYAVPVNSQGAALNNQKSIVDQLYLSWINKEFDNPKNFFIEPTGAGYYLHNTTLNKVHNTTSVDLQLLHDTNFKILQAFKTLQENL